MKYYRLVIIILVIFGMACASSGRLSVNIIPDDTEDYFLDRYYFLTDGGTRICLESDALGNASTKGINEKEFKKLSSDQRNRCIKSFWKARDPNPLTPENENKIIYDQRIEDVRNELLFLLPGLHGFRFEHNGGYKGEPAMVYLLLGRPHRLDSITDNMFLTDLMLWVYGDERGQVLYKFLFYKKNNMGWYRIFRNYYGTLADRLIEVSRGIVTSNEDLEDIYRELQIKDPQGWFMWALYEFSPLGGYPDQALRAPMSAEQIYRVAGSIILGLPVKLASEIKIKFSESPSMIFGDIRILRNSNGEAGFYLLTSPSALDWELAEGKAEVKLRFEVNFTNQETGEKIIFLATARIILNDINILDKQWDAIHLFPLPISRPGKNDFDNEVASLDKVPSGRYAVSIYLRHLLTQKYNQWEKTFTK